MAQYKKNIVLRREQRMAQYKNTIPSCPYFHYMMHCLLATAKKTGRKEMTEGDTEVKGLITYRIKL
jgi:hypothetical protein